MTDAYTGKPWRGGRESGDGSEGRDIRESTPPALSPEAAANPAAQDDAEITDPELVTKAAARKKEITK